MKALFLVLPAVLCSMLGAAPLHAGEIPIRGQVISPAAVPLEGARIELHQGAGSSYQRQVEDCCLRQGRLPVAVSRTDAGGFFELMAPEAGLYEVHVRAAGHLTVGWRLRPLIEPMELPPVRLRRATEIRVTVENPQGESLPGARVHLPFTGFRQRAASRAASDLWRPPERFVFASDAGPALLQVAQSEYVRLFVFHPGFLPAVPEDLNLLNDISVRLRGGVGRTIEVRDGLGRAVASAVLTAWPVTPDGARRFSSVLQGLTDDMGRLRVAAPPEGKLWLTALTPSGLIGRLALGASSEDVRGAEDDAGVLALVVEAPVELGGRIIDRSTGHPVVGAWLVQGDDVVRTGSEGEFSLPFPVETDEGQIRVEAPGYTPEVVSVRRSRDGTWPDLVLDLTPSILLPGRVVDEDDRPVTGARIEITELTNPSRVGSARLLAPTAIRRFSGYYHPRGGQRFLRSGVEGLVVFSAAPEGSYALLVTHDGFLPTRQVVWTPKAAGVDQPTQILLRRGRTGFGHVLDLREQPIANAEVRMWLQDQEQPRQGGNATPYVSTTDEQGRFEISDLKPGRFDFRATAEGFAPLAVENLSLAFDSRAAGVDLGTVILEPGVGISGRVTDPDERPISGATISYEPWSSEGRLRPWDLDSTEVKSDEEGFFHIGDLLPGEKLDLTLWHIDYVAAEARGVASPAEDLSFILRWNSIVRGRVVGPDDEPVAEAEVWASFRADEGGKLGQRDECDSDGNFELDRVGSRGVELTALAPGFRRRQVWLDLDPGEVIDGLVFRLERGAVLEGTVFDPLGTPVAEAWVSRAFAGTWRPPGSSGRGLSSFGQNTDDQGRFRLDGLELGPMEVHAMDSAGHRTKQGIEIQSGLNTLKLHFEEGFEVRGRVVDADGLAISDVQVSVGGRPGLSDADGGFVIEQVSPGWHALSAWKSGFANQNLPDLEVAGPVSGVEVELHRGTRVSGKILGREDGAHADIWGRSLEGGKAYGSAEFDGVGGVGTYGFSALTPGKWTFEAMETGSGRVARGVLEIEPGQRSATLDLEFQAGLVFSGTVRVDGRPEAGGSVRLRGLDVLAGGGQRTDYAGSFSFDDLKPGRFALVVRGTDRTVLDTRRIDLTSSTHLDIDLSTRELWGEVVDAADGGGLESARLTLERRDQHGEDSAASMEAITDARGSFRFERLSEGSYRLRVEKPGYSANEQQIDIVAGFSEENLRLALEPTAGASLKVSHAHGAAPAAVYVAVLTSDVSGPSPMLPGRFLVTGDSWVRLASLPPGQWDVLVRSATSGSARLWVSSPGEPVPVVLPRGTRLEVSVPDLVGRSEIATVTMEGEDGPFHSVESGGLRREWRIQGGWAAIEGLPPGDWLVHAKTLAGDAWSGRVRTESGGGSVRLVLE